MKSIRSGSGLGDSIYLQSVVRHLAQREEIEVCSDWPDVFRPLGDRVTVSPFRRNPIDIRAHYAMRKGAHGTDQFEDVCIAAGVPRTTEFRLGWKPIDGILTRRVRHGGRPVILVQLPRRPFDRKDGFGMELLPDCSVIQDIIDRIGTRAKFVLVGKGEALHRFTGIDLDLSNQTGVADLFDIASAADGLLGYVSFFVPLSESLGKPGLFVWSSAGLNSRHEFVRQITPEKIFHRASSHAIIDDGGKEITAIAVDQFLAEIAGRRTVRGQERSDCRIRAGGAR